MLYLSLSSQFKLIVKYKTQNTLGWACSDQHQSRLRLALSSYSSITLLEKKYLFVMQIAEIAEIAEIRDEEGQVMSPALLPVSK